MRTPPLAPSNRQFPADGSKPTGRRISDRGVFILHHKRKINPLVYNLGTRSQKTLG